MDDGLLREPAPSWGTRASELGTSPALRETLMGVRASASGMPAFDPVRGLALEQAARLVAGFEWGAENAEDVLYEAARRFEAFLDNPGDGLDLVKASALTSAVTLVLGFDYPRVIDAAVTIAENCETHLRGSR